MAWKFALKRLTASDLTLFEWQFKNRNAGNQKAINLNANVFVDLLYPSVEAAARASDNKLPLDLWVVGPGAREAVNLQRKIIKGSAYKNWRLNGEFINNPLDDPDRFNTLRPSDLVLLAFDGEIVPSSATAVFVAQDLVEDAALYSELDDLIGEAGMVALSEERVASVCDRAGLLGEHIIRSLILDEDLRDAAVGIASATERLVRSGRTAKLSSSALRKARDAADETGRLGEALINIYLRHECDAGRISKYEWVSASNAIAPLDFRFEVRGEAEKLDVKCTSGIFDREFHISFGELKEMARSVEPYRIYRVYNASEDGASLRISEDMKPLAQNILDAFCALPDGVIPDGVSIQPIIAHFGEELVLSPDAGEEE